MPSYPFYFLAKTIGFDLSLSPLHINIGESEEAILFCMYYFIYHGYGNKLSKRTEGCGGKCDRMADNRKVITSSNSGNRNT